MRRLLLLIALFAGLLAPGRAQPASAAGVRYLDEIFTNVSVTYNLVYGNAPNYAGVPTDLKLDLYQPIGDTERNRPAIVYIHGGSFSGGSKSEGSQVGMLAAKRGYVVVSIDYRVVAGALTDLAKLAWAIPAAQHDAQAAVRWLRRNADALGINPVAISSMGYSAGAITALHVAHRSFDVGSSGNPGYASDVIAAVSMAGSAIEVRPDAPPAILFHGSNDVVVPYNSAVQTCQQATTLGDRCELHTYPAGHDLSPYFSDIRPKIWSFLYGEVLPALQPPRPPSGFHPVVPARVLDTRDGTGLENFEAMGAPAAAGQPLGPGMSLDLTVAGRGGVPATGVRAVVLNVTAVGPSADTHITVWPAGAGTPATSNLNVPAGRIMANLVTIGVSPDGRVSLRNNAGTTHLVADVMGWFDDGSVSGAGYVPLPPARLLDTRDGTGAPAGPLVSTTPLDLTVAGRGGVAPDAVAVVLNITGVAPSAATHLTVWPTGEAVPATSNLNLLAGETAPNLVMVKVGTGGKVRIRNNTGAVDVVADVAGYFAPGGNRFVPVAPTRVLDTRDGTGGVAGAIGSGSVNLRLRGRAPLPPAGVSAVVLNLTGLWATQPTHVTAWPAWAPMPTASNLNVGDGRPRPNLVVVSLSGDGRIALANHAGNIHLIADVVGYFS